MIPIPAIDLKNGKVVRLLHGKFSEEKIYFEKAQVVAKNFEDEGAGRLHVVDLDGALRGKPVNRDSVESILKSVRMPVEIGGGIRSLELAGQYLKLGASWVILGTQACLDRGFLKEALSEFKNKIIVGIDASDGFVVTDGWSRITDVRAGALAQEAERLGGQTLIYTDISKDGALLGPNLSEIQAMSRATKMDVIASGGVASLSDLTKIKDLGEKNIIGVIIGKAFYERKFTLKEAIDVLRP